MGIRENGSVRARKIGATPTGITRVPRDAPGLVSWASRGKWYHFPKFACWGTPPIPRNSISDAGSAFWEKALEGEWSLLGDFMEHLRVLYEIRHHNLTGRAVLVGVTMKPLYQLLKNFGLGQAIQFQITQMHLIA